MKLVLANSQAQNYTDFYARVQADNPDLFDYTLFADLLFSFGGAKPISVRNIATGRELQDYDGIYIKSYSTSYELAATVAICCEALHIPLMDHELVSPPSLSKLSGYAKLAAAGVSVPETIAGTTSAITRALKPLSADFFPAVLKRASADRGRDNYMVQSKRDITELLEPHNPDSVWLLQRHIANDGFYRITFNAGELAFCIFRKLEPRSDGDPRKAHMYKPNSGSNATLLKSHEVPPEVLAESEKAAKAMDRQMAGVDCLFDAAHKMAYVLEVNNNPQLVSTSTFQDVRIAAFVESLKKDWKQI